jgi:antitoxin ParD1/3/4
MFGSGRLVGTLSLQAYRFWSIASPFWSVPAPKLRSCQLANIDTMCQMRWSSDMANRTTVNISITPELDAFLQSRVQSGRYQTTSEVVREALRLLERQENERDEARRQLKAKLERGAAQAGRGELLDGDEVFDELREIIEERKRAKQKAPVR